MAQHNEIGSSDVVALVVLALIETGTCLVLGLTWVNQKFTRDVAGATERYTNDVMAL